MLEMKPEIRKQWCDALRSGEYTQVKGCLRWVEGTDASYCCLGVLTDLYVKAGGPVEFVPSWSGRENVWNCGVTATPVMDWAGLKSSNPELGSRAAAEWNDETDLGFAGIADLIDGGKQS